MRVGLNSTAVNQFDPHLLLPRPKGAWAVNLVLKRASPVSHKTCCHSGMALHVFVSPPASMQSETLHYPALALSLAQPQEFAVNAGFNS